MSEATTITIGVVDCEDLSPTGVFRVNENTPFRKVMDTWERQHGRCDDNVMYFFDGMRVAHSDTPRNLHMVDGDEASGRRKTCDLPVFTQRHPGAGQDDFDTSMGVVCSIPSGANQTNLFRRRD